MPDWNSDLPVLVIDDDHAVRLALADLLTRWGVRFDMAEGGGEALLHARGARATAWYWRITACPVRLMAWP